MKAITRSIKARKPVKCDVDYVVGTNAIPVDFVYDDFPVPEGSTATAVAVCGEETEEFDCTVTDNTIWVMPEFTAAGTYICQVKLKDSRDRTLHGFPVIFHVYPFCGS